MKWQRTFVLGCATAVAGCGPSVPPATSVSSSSSTMGSDDRGPPPAATMTTSNDTAPSATSSSGNATSTTVAQDDSGDSSVDESDFVFPVDFGRCFTSCISCDLWAQDCPEGQKCNPWDEDGTSTWNAQECFDLAPMPGAPGDACVVEGSLWGGIDDCMVGAMCWNVDPETNAGECVGFCEGSEANPVCDEGRVCFGAYRDHDVVLMHLCLPTCDPIVPACEPGLACVKSNALGLTDSFACIPEVLVADRSTYADACDEVIGCGTGLLCTSAADVPGCAEECCTALCDPLAANLCPDAALGQICVAHGGDSTLGHCGFR